MRHARSRKLVSFSWGGASLGTKPQGIQLPSMAPAGTSLRQDDETLLVDCGTWSRSGVPRQKRHFVHRMAACNPSKAFGSRKDLGHQGWHVQERAKSTLITQHICLGLSVLSQMQHVAVMQPHQSTSLNLNSPTSPDVTSLYLPLHPVLLYLPRPGSSPPTRCRASSWRASCWRTRRTPGARTPRRSRPAASASEEPRGSGCGGAGGFKAPVEVG